MKICLAFLFIAATASADPIFHWGGDLRLRAMHEKDGDNDGYWKEKYRVRFGLGIAFDSDLKAEIRLATGKSNRDQDQVMGDHSSPGSPRRFFGLDRAYADWSPFSFVHFYLGRIPQVHERPGGSQILLDEDIALEGAAVTLEQEILSSLRVFANAGSVSIRQNYDAYYGTAETDNMLNWMQMGGEWKWDILRFKAGAGFFNFVGVKGVNFSDLVNGGAANGNSQGSAGVVYNPYLPRDYFLEAGLRFGELRFTLFGERVINDEVAVRNSAWWAGLRVGEEKWEAALSYVELQPDAVLGVFTDSEFAAGRVDAHGFVASLRWKFTKNMTAQATEYLAQTQESVISKEFHRTNIDLLAEF